eukprot:12261884-Karenia_brevis.AAC.1
MQATAQKGVEIIPVSQGAIPSQSQEVSHAPPVQGTETEPEQKIRLTAPGRMRVLGTRFPQGLDCTPAMVQPVDALGEYM